MIPILLAAAVMLPMPQVAAPPPEAIVTSDGHAFAVRFVPATPDAAALVVRIDGAPEAIYPLSSPSAVLKLLADPRFAALWPSISTWASAGLAAMRDRAVADARIAIERGYPTRPPVQTSETSVRPPTRALLQYAAALTATGRFDEAISLLRQANAKNQRKTDWQQVEWTIVATRIASILANNDDYAAAIEQLRAAKETLGGDNVYALNFDTNRAAFLAMAGRYEEALTLIDAVIPKFTQTDGGRVGHGREKVPGSMLQFQWIRACALHGLGRTAEAKELIDGIAKADQPTDRYLLLPANDGLELRAQLCMRDADGLADFVVRRLNGPAIGTVQLVLQPDMDWPPELASVMAKVRADPRVLAAEAGKVRTLPTVYDDALNGWRPRRGAAPISMVYPRPATGLTPGA